MPCQSISRAPRVAASLAVARHPGPRDRTVPTAPGPRWAALPGITLSIAPYSVPTYRRYTLLRPRRDDKAQCTNKSNRSVHGMVHAHIPMTSNVSSTPPRTHLRAASQNGRMPPPLKPHAPSPPLSSTMRAAAHTRHSGNAAHAERGPTCMCVRRAPSRARPCVAPPGSACSRRLCPAVRWSDRAHAAARGNPDESVAADASGASHGARRAHARERCGACWSSAQRAPEPAYARVT